MKERLQKIIAASGAASRRKAEELIQSGLVTVNGTVAKLGDQADAETDEICLNGQPVRKAAEYVYILLNKPRGYVTTLRDEQGRKNITELVDCGTRVYPVGRLDMYSEGLLLLTNDGELTNRLIHPSHEIDKKYLVRVAGFRKDSVEMLARPIVLDGYRIRKPGVKLLEAEGETALLEVTIHEGRNRQIRRMAQVAGLRVLRLRRIQEGPLKLGALPAGSWRYLTAEEISSLRSC